MYSIILTKESHTENTRRAFHEFLEVKDFVFVRLVSHYHYSGFLIQQNLNDEEKESIRKMIRTFPEQSSIFFEEGIRFIQSIDPPRNFDFEDYDDTNISGPSIEMDIDKLINETSKSIKECIVNPITRKQAVFAVSELWIGKIREWVETNKK